MRRGDLVRAKRNVVIVSFLDFLEEIDERPDVHEHRCDTCGNVWEHERPRGVSEEEYRKAHTCGKCGEVQFWRFRK